MTHQRLLVGSSFLSVLLLTLHLAEDAYHSAPGTIEAGWGNLTAIALLAMMLAGPALLADRRSGRMIMVFVAIAAIGMPVLHFTNNGNRSRYNDALLFIWCLIVLGVNGLFSLMLWVSHRSSQHSPGE